MGRQTEVEPPGWHASGHPAFVSPLHRAPHSWKATMGTVAMGNWPPAEKRLEGQGQWERCGRVYLSAFSLLSAAVLRTARLSDDKSHHKSLSEPLCGTARRALFDFPEWPGREPDANCKVYVRKSEAGVMILIIFAHSDSTGWTVGGGE